MANEKNSLYEQVIQQFTFEGDERDIVQLQELVSMIASVPSGQRVLQDALNRKTPLTISFCDGFEDKNTKGIFLWRERAVRLVRLNKNLPETDQIKAKLEMSNIMAHELQHYVDKPFNKWLDQNAYTLNEGILSIVLCEMSAFKTGDSVETELRTLRGMPIIWMPKTPGDWKKAMSRALSGDNKRIKWYIDRRHRMAQKISISFEQKLPSKEFYQGVTDYLNKLNIPMNFTEAMLCVIQSQKLLPLSTPYKPSKDR